MSSSGLPLDPIAEARRLWVAHGWEHAAEGMAAITSLMRAHQIALARVEAVLRPYGVTFARYEVLMLLYFSRKGSLPMAMIGERLQVHPTSVTNAVDRLEAAGLVQRTPHAADRRSTVVVLLDEGRELAESATAALNTEVFGALGVSAEGTTALVQVLTEMRHNAGDFWPAAPQAAASPAATAARVGVSFEDFQKAAAEQIPVRRVGRPDDIANVASFLVSDAASFVSGQVVYVAGGPAA